jgi:hypothetical protein
MSYERKWTRRKFIRNSAATAAALPLAAKSLRLRAAEPPACVFNPEQEEGPYYVDRELLRGDITEGKIGVPLRVRVTIVDAKTCAPLPNAALDIWHCDASGVYSGYTKINPGGPGGPGGGPGFPGGRPPGPPPNGGSGGDDGPPQGRRPVVRAVRQWVDQEVQVDRWAGREECRRSRIPRMISCFCAACRLPMRKGSLSSRRFIRGTIRGA